MRILVIIPAYNEGAVLVAVTERLKQSVQHLPHTVDYVIVNDGSTDDTQRVIEAHRLNAITLPQNLGIGGAVQTGYLYAAKNGYDIAIQMDGDGQHLPEYIAPLITPLLAGTADMSIGSRFLSGQDREKDSASEEAFRSSRMRRFGIRSLSRSIRLVTGITVRDATSGFRAVNRRGIELFSVRYAKDYPEPESIVRAVKSGLTVQEVPVRMAPRTNGTSSIRLFGSVYYMIKVTLSILLIGFEQKAGRSE